MGIRWILRRILSRVKPCEVFVDAVAAEVQNMSYARISRQLHQPATDVRHPMYEFGDKLGELRDAIAGDPVMRKDGALGGLLRQAEGARSALHRHLEENYLWD